MPSEKGLLRLVQIRRRRSGVSLCHGPGSAELKSAKSARHRLAPSLLAPFATIPGQAIEELIGICNRKVAGGKLSKHRFKHAFKIDVADYYDTHKNPDNPERVLEQRRR